MGDDTLLVIVGGAPASGKTTLARQLSRDLRIPVFSKDDFKEMLFERLGSRDREWSKTLGSASFDLLVGCLRELMTHGVSCIVESAFRPSDAPIFEEIRRSSSSQIIQLFCDASPSELRERFRQRALGGQRHPGHCDASNMEELDQLLASDSFVPLKVEGELIRINTGAASGRTFRSDYRTVLSTLSGG